MKNWMMMLVLGLMVFASQACGGDVQDAQEGSSGDVVGDVRGGKGDDLTDVCEQKGLYANGVCEQDVECAFFDPDCGLLEYSEPFIEGALCTPEHTVPLVDIFAVLKTITYEVHLKEELASMRISPVRAQQILITSSLFGLGEGSLGEVLDKADGGQVDYYRVDEGGASLDVIAFYHFGFEKSLIFKRDTLEVVGMINDTEYWGCDVEGIGDDVKMCQIEGWSVVDQGYQLRTLPRFAEDGVGIVSWEDPAWYEWSEVQKEQFAFLASVHLAWMGLDESIFIPHGTAYHRGMNKRVTVFEFIQDQTIAIHEIITDDAEPEPGFFEARYIWIEFFVGDAQVGGIFEHGQLDPLALIDDGFVFACVGGQCDEDEPWRLTLDAQDVVEFEQDAKVFELVSRSNMTELQTQQFDAALKHFDIAVPEGQLAFDVVNGQKVRFSTLFEGRFTAVGFVVDGVELVAFFATDLEAGDDGLEVVANQVAGGQVYACK